MGLFLLEAHARTGVILRVGPQSRQLSRRRRPQSGSLRIGKTMRTWLRDAPAWGVSLIINLAILVAMNLIIFTTVNERRLTTINSIVDDTDPNEMVFEATAIDQVGTEGDTSSYTPSLAKAIERSDEQQPQIEEKIEEALLPDVNVMTDAVAQVSTDMLTDQIESRGASEVQGGGVEGVMDRITFEIASSLKQKKKKKKKEKKKKKKK
eukprot:TRINITY_DN41141_c1_g1_i1.p1 TRINITY_DN41141_c1_g1~~TRINITY_DN41141_c1_g1_i1.p1  ORF type:complete len:208 (+),score=33.20 TRINITY_DN41141_c1_g1_i1:2-625(+)